MTEITWITGAASGLGKALARQQAESGRKVCIFDNNKQDGRQVADTIDGSFVACDVSEVDDWQRASEAALRATGKPTRVFLNASVMMQPAGNSDTDDIFDCLRGSAYGRLMRVNVDGALLALATVVRAMPEGGSIVVTSSLAGLTGLAFDPYYAMSKHAVIGMVRSFAPALKRRAIRLNAFCAGGVKAGMSPHLVDEDEAGVVPTTAAAEACAEVAEKDSTGGVWFMPGGDSELSEYLAPEMGTL